MSFEKWESITNMDFDLVASAETVNQLLDHIRACYAEIAHLSTQSTKTERPEMECPDCKKQFDPSDLAQVAIHMHSGLPIDDFIGIKGQRVKPTLQKWYETAEHFKDYAKQWESYATSLENKLAGYEGTTHHGNCGCEAMEQQLAQMGKKLEAFYRDGLITGLRRRGAHTREAELEADAVIKEWGIPK